MNSDYLNETDKWSYILEGSLPSYDWNREMSYDARSSRIFLSHSSQDKAQILPMAISVLRRHGAEVYIDAKDPRLPPITSEKTAEILRNRIIECKKFVVLVSENSSDSRWVPWELGYADGKKSEREIAIFPYVPTTSSDEWIGQEYLGCYSIIKRYRNKWVVYSKNAANPYTKLECWVQ